MSEKYKDCNRRILNLSKKQNKYKQTNLISDIAGIAQFVDPNIVNSWGIVKSPDGAWWVVDNGTGLITKYNENGLPIPSGNPVTIKIPPPSGTTGTSAPTGIVYNKFNKTHPKEFVISANGRSGPSIFLVSTEDGTIAGWNPKVDRNNAVLVVDRSTVGDGAVYKGLAIGETKCGSFLYATNFRAGFVEIFDLNFDLIRSFTDPELSSDCPLENQCYAPFGI